MSVPFFAMKHMSELGFLWVWWGHIYSAGVVSAGIDLCSRNSYVNNLINYLNT